LFTVTLADPADTSMIQAMHLDYPSHDMDMMGHQETVLCYDDGTHGDQVAGDGIYSYLDTSGSIGPHASDCPHGTYVYSFHGEDMAGHETNSVQCHVTVL
jgi:hypothetical protein